MWALPGGHVEATEYPSEAAKREVEEETGLVVDLTEPAETFYTDDLPGPGRVFFVYHAKSIGGTLRNTDEAVTPTFFARNEIPEALCPGGHRDAILAWSKGGRMSRDEMMLQLGNAAALRAAQDQVLWMIFAAFWAANSALLIYLFSIWDIQKPLVGTGITSVGTLTSVAWHIIQGRALTYIDRWERLAERIEIKLQVPAGFAQRPKNPIQLSTWKFLTPPIFRARVLMLVCSVASVVLWAGAFLFFAVMQWGS